MNTRIPENKDAVLLVAGMMLAAHFGQNLAGMLHMPVWAPATSMATGLGYFYFAHVYKANWFRATLATIATLLVGVGLTSIRLP
jgi:hypothetical protein